MIKYNNISQKQSLQSIQQSFIFRFLWNKIIKKIQKNSIFFTSNYLLFSNTFDFVSLQHMILFNSTNIYSYYLKNSKWKQKFLFCLQIKSTRLTCYGHRSFSECLRFWNWWLLCFYVEGVVSEFKWIYWKLLFELKLLNNLF